VGWTDITITTSLTAQILEGLGYKPQIQILGTDVTYRSMKNGDIDIFLGTWLPGLLEASAPFYADGSIEKVRTNLAGAKFTLAVPKYVFDAGVLDFEDLNKHKEKFGGKIFGLEPGGNKPIEEMIQKNVFDLGSWELVESSEAGMLTQVARAIASKKWIVFLGWAPHPMNRTYDIAYLAGGDEYYGKDYGAAIVNTDVRRGYAIECPNIVALLTNLEFNIEMENTLMEFVLGRGMPPEDAVVKWLKENPKWLERTLNGITTIVGEPGFVQVRAYLELK
jgi:glycine betaine/proline transport system substrate-binding protein